MTEPTPSAAPPLAPPARLWDAVDVATYLHLDPGELDAVLGSPGVPEPVVLGRTRRWVPRHWFEWADPTLVTQESQDTGRLWSLGEVADFLAVCENTAKKVLDTHSDVPGPVLGGRHRRWDPRAWWAWAEQRTQAATRSSRPARSRTAGRSTRV